MIDLILNIAINIEWLNSMFLTALSVITLVNIPLSHHAPCIPIMFSSSIFSKLNSLKYSKSIMNVLRIVLLRYVTSQRMKKSVTKLWKYVLCIYIELFGRHQNATSSSFSAHSLSLPPKSNLALLSADVQQQSLPHCIRGYICSNAAAASTPHAHLSGNSGLKQRRFSEQKSNKGIRHPRRVFLARLRTHMLRLTVPAKDLHWPLPVSRSTRADVILRPV